jgi:nitrogen fixation NifU-like protein
MYQEIILDHYRTPHHKGLRDPFDVEVHHVNPTCGDEVTLRVKVDEAADGDVVISDVSYDSMGCSISQASVSVMTDLVVGKSLAEATTAYDAFLALMRTKGDTESVIERDEEVLEDAVAFEGVSKYPARIKCALLGWMAWKDATARAVDSSTTTEETA